MITILKSKIFTYGLLVLSFAGLFYMWQHDKNTTKQLEEKTKQLQHIMDNPIEKIVEGPVKIIKGKTIVKEVIREIRGDGTEVIRETETITDPVITEKGPTTRETDYKDPIGEAEAKKGKYLVGLGYYFTNEITLNTGLKVFGLFIGPNLKYDIEDKNVDAGVSVSYLF